MKEGFPECWVMFLCFFYICTQAGLFPASQEKFHLLTHNSIKMNVPANCKYSEDHEWIRIESGNIAYVGITDYAQGELGELVYIEVETVGETIGAGEVFGTVEAVKTTSDLFMPVKAKVLEFNDKVSDSGDPSLVNSDAYGDGWLVKVEIADLAELNNLMDAKQYEAHIS